MTLTWLNPFIWLGGLAALAGLLYALQRLRVRHREVEVVTTIFWRQAVEEHRARVFRRRFRHLGAYLLLMAIAGLLWTLLAGPRFEGVNGRRYVILLDGSAAMSRDGRFEDAIEMASELAAQLPQARREVRLVAGHVETVLGADEALPLLAARLENATPATAPGAFEAALHDVAAEATFEAPATVYLVGDAPVRDEIMARLPATVETQRVPLRGALTANRGVTALGVAEATSGAWETVDVVFEIGPVDEPIPAAAVGVSLDGVALNQPLARVDAGRFIMRDVPAGGGELAVQILDVTLGGSVTLDDQAAITLPRRPRITVWLDDAAPEPLRAVLSLDPAVSLVSDRASAEVRIGAGADDDLRLVGDLSGAALDVTLGNPDADVRRLGEALIDELAIRQIDAMTLADQTGEEIRLDVVAGDARRIAVWRELLEETYDFRDSRGFPVFTARAVRWLAGRPPLIPWARAGEPVPAEYELVRRPGRSGPAELPDGRIVQVSLLERGAGTGALSEGDSIELPEGRGLDLFGLLGLLAVLLLAIEWVLYQRGRLP